MIDGLFSITIEHIFGIIFLGKMVGKVLIVCIAMVFWFIFYCIILFNSRHRGNYTWIAIDYQR